MLTFLDVELIAHTSWLLWSMKHHHRPALPAGAAILLALMGTKHTPKQKEALVDLKQEIDC